MGQNNLILTSGNQQLKITNFLAGVTNPAEGRSSLIGLPLGTAGNSATGELLTKVSIREATVTIPSITVTPTIVNISASASGNIPAGSKGWVFILLTGTGTLGSQALPTTVLPFIISSSNTLASNFAYTTGSTSSAWLYYET